MSSVIESLLLLASHNLLGPTDYSFVLHPTSLKEQILMRHNNTERILVHSNNAVIFQNPINSFPKAR